MGLDKEEIERIANLIENDPEWFQDDSVDDAVLVEALRFAAANCAVPTQRQGAD